ncbi:MAG: tetratricopeptide repeat protein, partial [Anaerolineae bacterium]|nr:tetratricopeptide repeat protein [Anaerolineae bacterium]
MLHHFPLHLTSFVGRTREIAEVAALLRQKNCRLLTLVGPGGAGKTRLALEAARQRASDLRDGAVFVPLQSINAAEFVIHAIAAALGITVVEGESAQDALLQILHTREMLLVLDNLEHVLDAVPLLLEFLERIPALQILVTSREVLNVAGEQIYEVDGLATDAEPGATSDAVSLFITRAAQARHDFDPTRESATIVEICQLVDAMPLAIELAASWTRSLSCAEIAVEIRRSADFLATRQRNMPDRHRNLRSVFEQSWVRLDETQQRAFSRLAVFSGHFTREAAAAVTGASLHSLSVLVDHSLVQLGEDGRYSIHSLLRQYAEEKLREAATEYDQIQADHAAYYLSLVRQLDPQIKSRGQIEALRQIDLLQDNIRQAWRYAVEQHRADLIAPAFEALVLYYQMRCRLPEAYDIFALAAEAFAADDNMLAGMLLLAKSWFTMFSGAHSDEQVLATVRQAVAILAKQTLPGLGAMLLWGSGVSHVAKQEMPRFLRENEAAYRARGDAWGLAWTLNQGMVDEMGNRVRTREQLEASIAIALRGGDRWGATWPQAHLGLIAEREGRLDEAFDLYRTRLETCEQIGDKGGVAWSLHQLAKVSLERNDIYQAIHYCRESLRVALEISSGNSVIEAIWRISFVYRQQGNLMRTVELLSALHYAPDHFIRHNMALQVEQELHDARALLSLEDYNSTLETGRRWTPRQLGYVLLDELGALLASTAPASRQSKAALP